MDGFGSHIDRSVGNHMEAYRRAPEHHLFTSGVPAEIGIKNSEERQRESSLGPSFGEFHSDLEALCL